MNKNSAMKKAKSLEEKLWKNTKKINDYMEKINKIKHQNTKIYNDMQKISSYLG